jgi:hypothetical protein
MQGLDAACRGTLLYTSVNFRAQLLNILGSIIRFGFHRCIVIRIRNKECNLTSFEGV